MTLIVAIPLPDRTVWMGGDRQVGGWQRKILAGPKVHQQRTPDGAHVGIGCAGAPRAIQVALTAELPPLEGHSLHWWWTTWADRVHNRLADYGQSVVAGEDGAVAAGNSGFVVALAGRVAVFDNTLSWEETAVDFATQGGAYELFAGAFEALREFVPDPIARARRAWLAAQTQVNVGPLADELTIADGA